MSAHLILASIGPVQEFIRQARRTRDLWYGSHLLSELSKAAARAAVDRGGRILAPALTDDELRRSRVIRVGDAVATPAPNRLLVWADASVDPAATAKAMRAEVDGCWRVMAQEVRREVEALIEPGCEQVWDEQVATLVEFLSAWTPVGEGRSFSSAWRRVERALADRKRLRGFAQWRHHRDGAPKSSLDGARASVLKRAGERPEHLVRKYRIAEGEQLDAVGLVKRAGDDPGQFVPVANIAFARWFEAAKTTAPRELAGLVAAAREADLGQVRVPTPCGRAFPFDAQVVMADRVTVQG